MNPLAWFRRWRSRPRSIDAGAVGTTWLAEQRLERSRQGWLDGPVWRTPREIARMRRAERLRARRIA